MTAFPLPAQGLSFGAARIVAWGGALVSLFDGLTTYAALRGHRGSELNGLQSHAIERFGLSFAIPLRVTIGAILFILAASLFKLCSGWQRRALIGIALVGVVATGAFVLNNFDVLLGGDGLLPRITL